MQGRKINSPGIEKAATFIGNEFRSWPETAYGRKRLFSTLYHLQADTHQPGRHSKRRCGHSEKYCYYHYAKEFSLTESAGYEKKNISSGDDFSQRHSSLSNQEKTISSTLTALFPNSLLTLISSKETTLDSRQCIFFLNNKPIEKYNVQAKHSFDIAEDECCRMLPDKSRKEEYIFPILRSSWHWQTCKR